MYLSAFSGPVEGILLICGMYFITAAKTPAFWQTPLIDLLPIASRKVHEWVPSMGTGLGDVVAGLHAGLSKMAWLRGISIVESFLYFGGFALLGNIANA